MARVEQDIEPFVVSCGGGLMLDRHIFDMPKGAAQKLQNYEPDIEGGYKRMLGFTPFDDDVVAGSGKILGIAILDANVIACRGANVEYGSGSGWISITTARTGAGKYHFDKLNWGTETLVMVDHGDTNRAATWDGSTYAVLDGAAGTGTGTAPTAPHEVEIYRNHIFLAEDNLLTFTAPFFTNKFAPADGGGQINVGFVIVALKQFREELYVFGKNKIVKITGASSADFKMVPVANNIGCMTCWSVQEVGGDLVFLAPDGIRTLAGTEKIDDIELSSISKPVQTRLNGISETSLVCSAVVRRKSQYRIWFPADATVAAGCRGLIGTYKNGEQGIGWEWSDIVGMKPAFAMSDYISNVEYVLHGGYSDGIVYRQERTNDFDGTVINATYKTPEYPVTDVGQRITLQRLIVNVANFGTVSFGARVRFNFGGVEVAQPEDYVFTMTGTGAVYNSSVYNTGIYSLDSVIDSRQSVEGSGFTVSLEFMESSSSSPFSIKGFQMEYTANARR